ncbi:mannose-1-phosphate guanyltransferase [Henriciella barbarensis]|uniref:Mannose-1-phosphate guanyltransferase n=1 Tax=Henriciella barbarensis TaxID=86342 RepID=A0A399R1K1_9PROT|nr:sugar phosphate nucleotidyltransferase [Henriciella barbarensis]RIJ23747.1 mannose-1-phosphate guanyltransferase [Henriciella barbarensis]
MTISIKPVVLCGGSGTRLWPLSTPQHPKQFLNLLGASSMLEVTLARVQGTPVDGLSFSRPMVIGAERHGDLMSGLSGTADILLEPVGKNSAAPVAAAALSADADDLVLILPADHDIADLGAFHRAILSGARAAQTGSVVTFGIIAETPATGYGYIEAASKSGDVIDVVRFVEKPDIETAKSYIASGNFFWNAGIFLFRAGDMIEAFKAHAPDILEAVSAAIPKTRQGTAACFEGAAFEACRSQSIDYAIIEHHDDLKVVPVDMGWSDIGDFQALWERSEKDENGNVLIGNVRAIDCKNCYIRATDTSISVAGRENTVIVAAGGETLVCDMHTVQSVKALARA